MFYILHTDLKLQMVIQGDRIKVTQILSRHFYKHFMVFISKLLFETRKHVVP